MSYTEILWTTTMIGFAVIAILAIFYVSWRIVSNAAKGNRQRRRKQTTTSDNAPDVADSSSS